VHGAGVAMAWARAVRVRVEIMGSQNCGIVGKSQSVLIMTNPIIFTRTPIAGGGGRCCHPAVWGALSEAAAPMHTGAGFFGGA
jgi:hypothetical protein